MWCFSVCVGHSWHSPPSWNISPRSRAPLCYHPLVVLQQPWRRLRHSSRCSVGGHHGYGHRLTPNQKTVWPERLSSRASPGSGALRGKSRALCLKGHGKYTYIHTHKHKHTQKLVRNALINAADRLFFTTTNMLRCKHKAFLAFVPFVPWFIELY